MSLITQNQAQFNPIRRSAMHHKHLLLGASMVERDGWQQPAHFGSAEADAKYLREALGLCDISPRAKFVIKGDQAEQLVSRVFPTALIPDVGEISVEAHAGGIHGANAALCRLAQDEIICVATTGLATWLADGLKDDSGQCVHSPEIDAFLKETALWTRTLLDSGLPVCNQVGSRLARGLRASVLRSHKLLQQVLNPQRDFFRRPPVLTASQRWSCAIRAWFPVHA